MRLIPVMLALLLALSPGAVAIQASTPTAPATAASSAVAEQRNADRTSDDANTTTVITLGTDPARTEFGTPSLALGSSLAVDRDAFRSQLSINTLDQQLEAAKTTEKKKQILIRYRYRIENRIISLKAKERQATQAFSNDTISKSEYLRTLGRIDAEADDIRNAVDAMRTRSQTVPRFNMKTEASTLKGKLVTLEGPVRDRIGQVTRGRLSTRKIYVSTSATGVVLSTIVGDTYVREIVRRDRRNPSKPLQLGLFEAQEAVLDQYSLTSEDVQGSNAYRLGSTNVYYVAVTHQHGNLVAYIDGGTEKVFRAIQRKRLIGNRSLPPGPGVTNSSENLTLVVNRTYPGGPLRVKLTNETGTPLQGQITVAGDSVGRTHDDGTLWTLGPSEQFRVNATYRGRTVNVTATPAESS